MFSRASQKNQGTNKMKEKSQPARPSQKSSKKERISPEPFKKVNSLARAMLADQFQKKRNGQRNKSTATVL
jgi:hypothetical protein